MAVDDLTTPADSSTADPTGTSDEFELVDPGSDLGESADPSGGAAALEDGHAQDGDDDDIPEPYHRDPAWQRIQDKRRAAEAKAADAEQKLAESQQWADISLKTAKQYGFNTVAEYQAAIQEAEQVQAEQAETERKKKAQDEEDARRAEYVRTYGDEEMADRLVKSDRALARAEQIERQQATREYNALVATAKTELEAVGAWDTETELLVKSFGPRDLPRVVKQLKKLAAGNAANTQTIARAEAAKAQARAAAAPPPESGRGATPGVKQTAQKHRGWTDAILESMKKHGANRKRV